MEENLTGNETEFLERQETARKVKKFLVENKDALILAGQLTLVVVVCIAGIKNDIMPDCCRKKKKRKKRKKRR